MASAIPVLPLVGSRMIVSELISPAFSAASIMATPMRSFTLPAGLKNSSLATTSATAPSVTRRSRTSGVLPISWVMFSAMLICLLSNVGLQNPADLEFDGLFRGHGEGDRSEPLGRPIQGHARQYSAAHSVWSGRGQCYCGCARDATEVEV